MNDKNTSTTSPAPAILTGTSTAATHYHHHRYSTAPALPYHVGAGGAAGENLTFILMVVDSSLACGIS